MHSFQFQFSLFLLSKKHFNSFTSLPQLNYNKCLVLILFFPLLVSVKYNLIVQFLDKLKFKIKLMKICAKV